MGRSGLLQASIHSRFGELCMDSQCVKRFSEKPQSMGGFVSGGFFVFNKEFFSYLDDSDERVLEKEPIERLVADEELMMYPHNGFWQCCDTYRELEFSMLHGITHIPPGKCGNIGRHCGISREFKEF